MTDLPAGKDGFPRSSFNSAVYRQPDRIVDAATGRTWLIDAILKGDAEVIRGLLEAGADPGKADNDGQSPLHHAARLGQIDTVRQLVQRGAWPNGLNKLQRTPLFEAVGAPHAAEMVQCLLEAGADANVAASSGRLPLHLAALGADLEVVELLRAATVNPLHADKKGNTALHLACLEGSREIVRALISAGMPVFCVNDASNTPLHCALQREGDDVAEYLLTTEAARLVNAVNIDRQSSLHVAVKHGKSAALVQKLLAAGADPNLMDAGGNTPAHLSVTYERDDLLSLFIHHGADISKTGGRAGLTLLQRALLSKRTASLRILLDCGADPDFTWPSYTPALTMAAEQRNLEALEMLLAAGANPNPVSGYRSSPLHIACLYGLEALVRRLLEAGADPNVPDATGRTPLHIVAYASNGIKLSQLLLEHDADPVRKNNEGITAFDMAYGRRSDAIMEMFRAKLAKKGVVYTPKAPPPPPPSAWDMGFF